METKEQMAEVLDRAHDELMVRGRCQVNLSRPTGEVCLVGAVAAAQGKEVPFNWDFDQIKYINSLYDDPVLAEVVKTLGLERRGTRSPGLEAALWNDDQDSDDPVFDALRNTAKRLREEAQS